MTERRDERFEADGPIPIRGLCISTPAPVVRPSGPARNCDRGRILLRQRRRRGRFLIFLDSALARQMFVHGDPIA